MPCHDSRKKAITYLCTVGTRQCEDPRHIAPFAVCHNCAGDTLKYPFAREGRVFIDEENPGAGPPFRPPTFPLMIDSSPWTGFLTRLCRYCEGRELKLKYSRERMQVPGRYRAEAGMPQREQLLMQDPPWNTCTCYNRLTRQNRTHTWPHEGGYRHCMTHRRKVWKEMILRKEANVSR